MTKLYFNISIVCFLNFIIWLKGLNFFPLECLGHLLSLCFSQIPLQRYPKFHRTSNQPSTLVLYLFQNGGYCLTEKTNAKQEKSVLLFRLKNWRKRDRKQHNGGYEGIFPCDIVNCFSPLQNNFNNYYYIVAGVLYVLCMLTKRWRRWYAMVVLRVSCIRNTCTVSQSFKTNSHRVSCICLTCFPCIMMEASNGMVALVRDYFEKVKVCEKCGGGRTIRDL